MNLLGKTALTKGQGGELIENFPLAQNYISGLCWEPLDQPLTKLQWEPPQWLCRLCPVQRFSGEMRMESIFQSLTKPWSGCHLETLAKIPKGSKSSPDMEAWVKTLSTFCLFQFRVNEVKIRGLISLVENKGRDFSLFPVRIFTLENFIFSVSLQCILLETTWEDLSA